MSVRSGLENVLHMLHKQKGTDLNREDIFDLFE